MAAIPNGCAGMGPRPSFASKRPPAPTYEPGTSAPQPAPNGARVLAPDEAERLLNQVLGKGVPYSPRPLGGGCHGQPTFPAPAFGPGGIPQPGTGGIPGIPGGGPGVVEGYYAKHGAPIRGVGDYAKAPEKLATLLAQSIDIPDFSGIPGLHLGPEDAYLPGDSPAVDRKVQTAAASATPTERQQMREYALGRLPGWVGSNVVGNYVANGGGENFLRDRITGIKDILDTLFDPTDPRVTKYREHLDLAASAMKGDPGADAQLRAAWKDIETSAPHPSTWERTHPSPAQRTPR